MATVTLRPAGVGTDTSHTPTGAATNHGCVSEDSVDNDTTYVYKAVPGSNRDLYTIDANSIGASDTINSITVYVVGRMVTTGGLISTSIGAVIRENATTTSGTLQALTTTSYVTKSQTWTTKPSSGTAFTQTDITNLEIGVTISISDANNGRCTQVYVVVDYTPTAGGTAISKVINVRYASLKNVGGVPIANIKKIINIT